MQLTPMFWGPLLPCILSRCKSPPEACGLMVMRSVRGFRFLVMTLELRSRAAGVGELRSSEEGVRAPPFF
jgi:hypothetical protein